MERNGGSAKFQVELRSAPCRPVHFNDVLATIYRQLGVATDEVFHNAFGQPVPVLARGKVIEELV